MGEGERQRETKKRNAKFASEEGFANNEGEEANKQTKKEWKERKKDLSMSVFFRVSFNKREPTCTFKIEDNKDDKSELTTASIQKRNPLELNITTTQ